MKTKIISFATFTMKQFYSFVDNAINNTIQKNVTTANTVATVATDALNYITKNTLLDNIKFITYSFNQMQPKTISIDNVKLFIDELKKIIAKQYTCNIVLHCLIPLKNPIVVYSKTANKLIELKNNLPVFIYFNKQTNMHETTLQTIVQNSMLVTYLQPKLTDEQNERIEKLLDMFQNYFYSKLHHVPEKFFILSHQILSKNFTNLIN